MIRQLPVPPDALSAGKAVKLFRGWVIDGMAQFALLPTTWKDDRRLWGQFLADAAIHVSNALGESTGCDPREALCEIARAFLDEVREPTGTSEGEFLDPDP